VKRLFLPIEWNGKCVVAKEIQSDIVKQTQEVPLEMGAHTQRERPVQWLRNGGGGDHHTHLELSNILLFTVRCPLKANHHSWKKVGALIMTIKMHMLRCVVRCVQSHT